mmetsp:Transcript_60514/g.131114  ORF Transcript_60514/g.131114 Transcript_60514/m.131114 type:complete len:477 (-) Transcript_60514:121-1551(-)
MAGSSATMLEDNPKMAPMNFLELSLLQNTLWAPESQVPSSWSNINVVLLLKTLPSEEKFRETMKTRLCKFLRFRAVPSSVDSSWKLLPANVLEMAYHVVTEAAVSSEAEFSAAVDRFGGEELDQTRPLWRAHLIPCRYQGGLSAVVLRLHHSIGDGIHLSQLINEVMETADGGRPAFRTAVDRVQAQERSCWNRFVRRLRAVLGAGPAFVKNAMASKKVLADSKWHLPPAARRAGAFYGSRRVLLLPPFSLSYIQECKSRASVTVNDVLQGALAGAIRRHCERQGDPLFVEGQKCSAPFQALVPVALPQRFPPDRDARDRLTNNWCMISPSLPVGEVEPLARVKATNKEMSQLKASMIPMMGLITVNRIAPHLPLSFRQTTNKELFGCHSCVFSNVPGPQDKLYLSGQPVEGLQAVFYNLIPQISLISYSGLVWMNLVADPEVIQDLDTFSDCFLDELKELGRVLGVQSELVPPRS